MKDYENNYGQEEYDRVQALAEAIKMNVSNNTRANEYANSALAHLDCFNPEAALQRVITALRFVVEEDSIKPLK